MHYCIIQQQKFKIRHLCCVCSHSHKVKGAVGDEEHLLSVLRQLLQHSVALLTIADILFCEKKLKMKTDEGIDKGTLQNCLMPHLHISASILGNFFSYYLYLPPQLGT